MRGRQTDMPRAVLPGQSSESVIWVLSFVLAAAFALGQILTVLAIAPAVIAFYGDVSEMPAFVAFFAAIGPVGIMAFLVAIDAAVMAVFVLMARRHWIGLAFLPPVLYLGIGSIVLWLLVSRVIMLAAPTG